MAVRSNYAVTVGSGRRLTVKQASALVKPGMWQRMATGAAAKGTRDYHWAMIAVTPDDTPGGQDEGHAVLLLRRHRYTGTVSAYLCWTPRPVPLARLIKVAVARWGIEEGHHLDVLAPVDRAEPARRGVPRRGRHLPARRRYQRRDPGADPPHRP